MDQTEIHFLNARLAELRAKYGKEYRPHWYDFQYEYYGFAKHLTKIKLDALPISGKKHVVAILDKQGNVVKIITSILPKAYLWDLVKDWQYPQFREMFLNKDLPDVEILEVDMEIKEAVKKRSTLNENKIGLKRQIKIKRILND